MEYDLSEMNRDELQTLRKQVDKALADYDVRRKKEARAEAEQIAAKYGFSLSELAEGAPPKARRKNPPKYQNPEDPSQTWTGRGRRPQWLQDALDQGRQVEDFLIPGAS
ncbi:H-NS histone family protein [Tranquillimonas alkanivorans]|uniref:DNA-binding protein H-NS n=1 Tax=Tranquillimonas alkanivorans TaxID=441119 RepID=A0A1I5WZZ1_9RHOB|nr:H-NS histone family protein [Tranquillimonas alkanivorans]SFQ25136.1 DNA-binding protein H-NS [Tranquillimonas alkanivorans]